MPWVPHPSPLLRRVGIHTVRRTTSDSFRKEQFWSTLRQVSGHDLSAKADASDCEQSLRSHAVKSAENVSSLRRRPARSVAEREGTKKETQSAAPLSVSPTLHPLNMLQNACLPDAPFTQSVTYTKVNCNFLWCTTG